MTLIKEDNTIGKTTPNQKKTAGRKVVTAVRIPDNINPRDLRHKLNMTQEAFSAQYGFNISTLRNWENNRRHPDQAVLAYLYAISKNPKLIEEILKS